MSNMLKRDAVMRFAKNPFFGLLTLFSAILILLLLSGCSADSAAQKKKASNLANLGSAMTAEGNARGGLQKLLEAAKLDPDNENIYQQIALVFRSLGDYPLSLKYFGVSYLMSTAASLKHLMALGQSPMSR